MEKFPSECLVQLHRAFQLIESPFSAGPFTTKPWSKLSFLVTGGIGMFSLAVIAPNIKFLHDHFQKNKEEASKKSLSPHVTLAFYPE